MEIFLDTHDVRCAFEFISNGIAIGITTNPTLIKKIDHSIANYYFSLEIFFKELLANSSLLEDKIRDSKIKKPIVHIEPIGTKKIEILNSTEKIIEILSKTKFRKLSEILEISIKIPITKDALDSIDKIKNIALPIRIKINATLCFSPMQAFIAAKHGADFISLFVGRLDDIGVNSERIINQTLSIFQKSNLKAKLLVASIRNLKHCEQAAAAGAHCITAQPEIIKEFYNHSLTSAGIDLFNASWMTSE